VLRAHIGGDTGARASCTRILNSGQTRPTSDASHAKHVDGNECSGIHLRRSKLRRRNFCPDSEQDIHHGQLQSLLKWIDHRKLWLLIIARLIYRPNKPAIFIRNSLNLCMVVSCILLSSSLVALFSPRRKSFSRCWAAVLELPYE